MHPQTRWEKRRLQWRAGVADASPISCIYVLAGTNGAGKSSVGGAMLSQQGVEYFNPDKAAMQIRSANPGITNEEANSAARYVATINADGRRRIAVGRRDLVDGSRGVGSSHETCRANSD